MAGRSGWYTLLICCGVVWYNMGWQYFLLKGFSRLLCQLPYSLVLRLGSGLGFLHYSFGHSQRRRAIRQLQERLGVSAEEAAVVARRMFMVTSGERTEDRVLGEGGHDGQPSRQEGRREGQELGDHAGRIEPELTSAR